MSSAVPEKLTQEALAALPLEDLASGANTHHALAESAARKALEHAFSAGAFLAEAKRKVPHGEWLVWLRENFSSSPRTAQRYMRLASGRAELEAKSDTVAHLTVRQALALLAEPAESSEASNLEKLGAAHELARQALEEIESPVSAQALEGVASILDSIEIAAFDSFNEAEAVAQKAGALQKTLALYTLEAERRAGEAFTALAAVEQ